MKPVVEFFGTNLTLVQNLEFVLRILLSALCGAVFGIERSRRFKEAGVRTHIIVCCAAAVMMMVSKYGFTDLSKMNGAFYDGTRGADPARIAAQVVSGISFLGAGMIFKTGSSVKGLTTAAGIWCTAGIGLAIGAGMYFLGIAATILIYAFQFTFHRLKIGNDLYTSSYIEIVATDSTDFYNAIRNMVEGIDGQIVDFQIARESGRVKYTLHLKTKDKISQSDVGDFFSDYPEIISIISKNQ